MRFQTQINQLRMLRVVVVLLGLYARILQVVDFDSQPHFLSRALDHSREIQHGKLLGELIEPSALTRIGGGETGDLDASHRIANVQESARLSAFAVNSEGRTNGCLHAETIQNRAKYFVVIKTVDQGFVQ